MHNTGRRILKLKWKPTSDLWAVAFSYLLVVAGLYTATVLVGQEIAGGMAYFGLYAILTATIFGLGIPIYWTVRVQRRPMDSLGITTKNWRISLGLQVGLAAVQFVGTLWRQELPPWSELLPLISLSLAIGFFEAVFWRGWVLQRLDEAFGMLPAIGIGSALYAAYHIGYAMPLNEMVFLFFIGLLYSTAFMLTRNILILWPLFQPMGQLSTLITDNLRLPTLASLGFIEVLALMFALVWLGWRTHRRTEVRSNSASSPITHPKGGAPGGQKRDHQAGRSDGGS